MVTFILLSVIKILLLILMICWITIGISLGYRKRRMKHLKLIEKNFAEITSNYLYPFPGQEPELVPIIQQCKRMGIVPSKPQNIQYLIDLMIRTQSSLLGGNYKTGYFV